MDLTYSFMLPLLQEFHKWTGSYGWSLILLTLFVRIILWPLVAKQTESMKRMSLVSPVMKKMQTKYKGDPELMQRKLMEFYSKNKVNPMGGCLPMLLQLPIFFALFATFSGPPFGDKPVNVHVKVVQAKDVKVVKKETSGETMPYVSQTGALSKVTVFPGETDIGVGGAMDFGTRAVDGNLPPDFAVTWKVVKDNQPANPVDAAIDDKGHATFNKEGDYQVQALVPGVAAAEQFGPVTGLGKVASGMALLKPENFDALGLIVLFGISMWLSQKFTMATSRPADEEIDEQTRVQQDTMKILPIVTTATFFFIPLPVGVLIYIVLSNIVQSFQTWLLMKKPAPPLVGIEELGLDEPSNGNESGGGSKKKSSAKKAISADNEGSAEGTSLSISNEKEKLKVKKKKKK